MNEDDKIIELLLDIKGISNKTLYPFMDDDKDRLEMINEKVIEALFLL
jgi:helix-turn-helix protein